jgi:hypothetical protein
LIKRLRSTGGRPALEGATERFKVPLGPTDIRDLEKILAHLESETGMRPSLSQIAGIILRVHLDTIKSGDRRPAEQSEEATPATVARPECPPRNQMLLGRDKGAFFFSATKT